MPTISVIVPVYKVEPYLHRCVDSILGQTYQNFELILVDDGSPDNCGAICDAYAAADSRVHVIHQKNGGLSAARNAGIDWAFANSDSQWISFIDSDDWVHPEYLERLVNAALEFEVAVSVCGYAETTAELPEIATDKMDAVRWNTDQFFMEHFVNATIACGKLYRKSCFAEIRYPVGRVHEDEFVTYRILFDHQYTAFIAAPLYAYFINDQGITKSNWSPRRMDALDAMEEQIVFYNSRSLIALKERVIRNYARTLIRHYRYFRKMALSDNAATKRFQKKAQWFLQKHRAYFHNDQETKINIFWIAHPVLEQVYHRIKKNG